MVPTYRATATILTGEETTNPSVKVDDSILAQRLATGYGALVKRQPVLEAAVKSLGLNTDWRNIVDNVLAVPVQGTALLEIRVTDSNPERAAALANEIVRQLI